MRHTVRMAMMGLAFGLVAGVAPASAQVDLVGEWLTPRAVQPDGAIAQQLEDIAGDLGASLIVAGAYGHSRFRELVLGGMTQHLITQSTRCVLLSH